MAKQPRVWTGTQWEELAVTLPDLSNYSTTTQMNSAIDTNAQGLVLISTTSLSGASVPITSIPQTYKDLKLVIRNFRPATDNAKLRLQINQDATANRHVTEGSGASVNTFTSTGINLAIDIDNGASTSLIVATIEDYTNSTTWKMVNITSISNNATTATSVNVFQQMGAYNQTNPVTSFNLLCDSGNITSGTLLLYGVR